MINNLPLDHGTGLGAFFTFQITFLRMISMVFYTFCGLLADVPGGESFPVFLIPENRKEDSYCQISKQESEIKDL